MGAAHSSHSLPHPNPPTRKARLRYYHHEKSASSSTAIATPHRTPRKAKSLLSLPQYTPTPVRVELPFEFPSAPDAAPRYHDVRPTQQSGPPPQQMRHSRSMKMVQEPAYCTNPLESERGTVITRAYERFLSEHPEYRSTWILDTLRRSDYVRLDRRDDGRQPETYVDYMGGSLYPASLIRVHSDFLNDAVLGNTHSINNSSKTSSRYASEARAAVLSFFNAPQDQYTVVFTANASSALKIVGESFPYTKESKYVLCADAHNSVHGIRQFASTKGAQVTYIPTTSQGGVDLEEAKSILHHNRPHTKSREQSASPSLFALTGQSNITNSKLPLSLLAFAKKLGYYTVLDAAALAPTSHISLLDTPVDAMAISFYKMFGYPTGIGALVVKKEFLTRLERPWFAGGTVDVVQVPGVIVTRTHDLHEQFEDGTINYTNLSAVTDGLYFLSAYLPFLPLRLSSLMHFLIAELDSLRHDSTSTPVVRILSRKPSKRLTHVGGQADTGSILSCVFLFPSGEMIPNAFIEYTASNHNISLRTGCMCNPGGAAALLGIQDAMETQLYPGITKEDLERFIGQEVGVVRISLGLATNFEDVWQVVMFVRMMGDERLRERLWVKWLEEAEPCLMGCAL